MKLSLKKSEFICFLGACLLGVLFHFIYEWSGNNFFLGLFFPVNESTWEHLKLIFFPITIMSLMEYYFLNIKNSNFICIKLQSVLLGMAATVVIFYTYSGVLGKNINAVDIAIFFIAMAISYRHSYKKLKKESTGDFLSRQCFLCFYILIVLFAFFTLYPLNIGLFQSPV